MKLSMTLIALFLATATGCKSQSSYRASYTQPALVQTAPACPPGAVPPPPPPIR